MRASGRIRPLLMFILVLWLPIAGFLLDKLTGCGLQEQLAVPASTPTDSE